jgi:hypothetical protein
MCALERGTEVCPQQVESVGALGTCVRRCPTQVHTGALVRSPACMHANTHEGMYGHDKYAYLCARMPHMHV